MIIIILGAPASGKGSVAEILSKELNIPSMSSGDIFRKYISEGGEIGKLADSYISKGNLVPDDVTMKIITSRLMEDDLKDGVILDGFPRTIYQAEELDKFLLANGKKVDIVICLKSNVDEVLNRILNRRICPKCETIYNTVLTPPKVDGICDKCGSQLIQRDDDTVLKARNRLKVYHKQTKPISKYYKEKGILIHKLLSERAGRMKDVVAKEIIDYINELEKKD